MKSQRNRIVRGALVAIGLCAAVVMIGYAQTPGQPGRGAGSPTGQPTSKAAMDAEREQIWNSPNMLRARAWLHDYFSKSAKVTPEMAKQYQAELENMTPAQMKLWLLKFDHEEEQRQQHQASWQQAHAAALSQAQAATRAAQQSYADFNREQSAAAGEAQQQLDEERQFEQSEAQDKQLELNRPYPYLYGPGYGGIHHHYHLYPYPY